jgi:hypothetical protein
MRPGESGTLTLASDQQRSLKAGATRAVLQWVGSRQASKERRSMSRYITSVVFILSSALFLACGDDDPEEELANAVNCLKIYQKYDECVRQIDV